MYRPGAAGHNKGVLAGAPIPDVGDFPEDCDFGRSSGLHELNNIYLEVAPSGPYRQPHRPGGLTDSLPKIDVNKAKAFISNVSGTLLWIKNDSHP